MAKNIVGRAYDENSKEVAKRIFERRTKSETIKPNGHACYFCRRRIDGNVNAVSIDEKTGRTTYYVDDHCYSTAKHTGIRNTFGELN